MEDQAVRSPSTPEVPLALPGAGWTDRRWLVLLLVLVAGLRIWQLSHTEVASRDSIAYIRIAWRLEHEPWGKVMRTSEHHPGYPLAIYLVSRPVCKLLPNDRPRAMQISSQLVSAIASLLLIFPMFYLGRELFDGRVGFWAALLFQCLPAPGRVLADGLSDPMYLLGAATIVWLVVGGLRTGKPGRFVLAGLCSGLTYLTRAEALVLPVMTVMVMLGLQASQRWRRNWRQLGGNVASLATVVLLAAPFMYHIGRLTTKPSALHMGEQIEKIVPVHRPHRPQARLVLSPLPLALWWEDTPLEERLAWSAKAVPIEINRGLFHLLSLPAFLGMILFRRRFLDVPGMWVMLCSGLLLTLLLFWLAQSNGYVGERHVLLIVMGSLYFAVPALALWAGWLARLLSRCRLGVAGSTISLLLLLLVTVSPLYITLSRLHGDRRGFKQAGKWLAENAKPGEAIIDPFAWSSYYAGQVFQPDNPPVESRTGWVVLERSDNPHPHLRYRLDVIEKLVADGKGELVKTFNRRQMKHSGYVEVYRLEMDGLHDKIVK